MNQNSFVVKTYTKSQLRDLYNVSEDTFRRWLADIVEHLPNYNPRCKILSPLQVKVLVENYGEP